MTYFLCFFISQIFVCLMNLLFLWKSHSFEKQFRSKHFKIVKKQQKMGKLAVVRRQVCKVRRVSRAASPSSAAVVGRLPAAWASQPASYSQVWRAGQHRLSAQTVSLEPKAWGSARSVFPPRRRCRYPSADFVSSLLGAEELAGAAMAR